MLELQHLKHAIIQNCTFGKWTFIKVQNAFIKDCNNIIDEGLLTSLKLINSSALIQNMTTQHENITGDYNGILVDNSSLLHIEQSKFVNNTVKQGIIKVLNSSMLIMSNCTVLGNYATEYPGVIYARESFVHLKNTYFNDNMANYGGGAIFIEIMVFLQIENCTFKNNSVDKLPGIGGAIAGLGNSKVSILNSIFQNNAAKRGGAVAMLMKSVLNVSSTIFENNTEISASTLIIYHTLNTRTIFGEGGGAIFLSKSVGYISESRFYNNSASFICGAIAAFTSSLSVSNTTFINNVAGVFGVNISNSSFSDNWAKQGGIAELPGGYLVMTNCWVSNNTANGDGGVIIATFGTLVMSTCLVFNNNANGDGGVFMSRQSKMVITTSIFSKNTALGGGGVFYVTGGKTLLKNSSFVKNIASQAGGVLVASGLAEINITESFCFGNQAGFGAGVLFIQMMTKILISDTKLSQNSADKFGVLWMDGSMLELNGSVVEGNHAGSVGGLFICNSSLVVAFNSSFNGNKGYKDSSFRIFNSTVYLEKCIFMKNQLTYGGTIFIKSITKFKVSETKFIQNEGYNLFVSFAEGNHSLQFESYRCSFVHGNISFKSNVKNFEEVAVKEKVISHRSKRNFFLRETPFASSKIFHILNIFNY